MEADCQDAQSPIQKIILRIGLADRPEMPDTDTRKYGGWEEFFTPDATRYLVEILVAGSAIWKGYITPDAWSETLDFHASVSVTARDNIGHLEDFEFASDSELISVDEIIRSAMALAVVLTACICSSRFLPRALPPRAMTILFPISKFLFELHMAGAALLPYGVCV